jgi:hypothetical protein
MVGATGFEPATSSSQTKRATRLRHAPTDGRSIRILTDIAEYDSFFIRLFSAGLRTIKTLGRLRARGQRRPPVSVQICLRGRGILTEMGDQGRSVELREWNSSLGMCL